MQPLFYKTTCRRGSECRDKAIEKNPLRIRPIDPHRAKKGAGPLVIETTINLDIPHYRGNEGLSRRNNPIKDHPFQPFVSSALAEDSPF